jgi:hypothetical protein
MIRRRRHARFLPASGAAGSDTDALQTDVMRFMSIIGLCLMAVFALVQGIPVQEPGKPAQAQQAAKIREDIRAQQQQLRELQAELHALKSEKDSTQQDLAQLAGQTQQARRLRVRLESQLEDLDRQLEQGRTTLADIEQDSTQEEHTLVELRGRHLDAQVQLDRAREDIAALRRPPPSTPVAVKQPPPKPVAGPVPEKRGFTLRFASDAALDRLVAAGSVILYGMLDKQAWRLLLQAGRSTATPITYPDWFHEMAAATVPAHYLRSLQARADGPGRSSVVWGVQLPAAAKAGINALLQEQQARGQPGGVLVIRADGRVTLEE